MATSESLHDRLVREAEAFIAESWMTECRSCSCIWFERWDQIRTCPNCGHRHKIQEGLC